MDEANIGFNYSFPTPDATITTFNLGYSRQTVCPSQDSICSGSDVLMDVSEEPRARTLQGSMLTTVNFDVQSDIMSFLLPGELSALMRTCKYFLDVALLHLCAHSSLPLKTMAQIVSFCHFLRLDRPSASRAPFIKDINFSLEDYRTPLTKANYFDVQESDSSAIFALPECHPLDEERLLLASRNHALTVFLHILPQCIKLRRLRVERWFEDVSISMLLRAIAELSNLEDLRMPMCPRTLFRMDPTMTKLPLRRLALRPGRWVEIPEVLSALSPLAATLVELDIPVCQWVAAPGIVFPHVQKLGIEFPASEDVVSDLVRTFPNLTHLSLRGNRNYHLCHTQSSRQDEDRLREYSQYQWHALTGSWPSFEMVSAETPCALYTLALPFHVPRISVGYSAGDPVEDMLPTILTDTHPSCIEMHVKQVHYRYMPLPRRFSGLQPGEATSSLRRFVLTMEGDGIPDYVKVSVLLVDELQRALAGLSVTHLLLRYTINHFRASCLYTRKVVRTICSEAPARAASMAQAVPSLQWVGIHVQVQRGPTWLYCWQVSRLSKRAQEFGYGAPPSVKLKDMSEDAGRKVLLAECIGDFALSSAWAAS